MDLTFELGLPDWTVNTCAMGHCCLSLYKHTGEQKCLDIVMSKADYLENKALRFGDRVLQHTVSTGNDFPEQVWADTLFMAAYTMSRVGKVLPEAYLYPRFMDVQGSLAELLPALKLCQTENGLWRTILDDNGSYEEVSASCGIAAAMAENGNHLHTRYVQKAIPGVLENISADGRVLNVSGGTAVMKDREGYRNISRDWIQGWGQGLALAFLSCVLESGADRGL